MSEPLRPIEYCSLPVPSVHGILQARIPDWVVIPFSRASSQPRGQTWISCITGGFFTIWATRESSVWNITNLLDKNLVGSSPTKQRVYDLSLLLSLVFPHPVLPPSALGQAMHWLSQFQETRWTLLGKVPTHIDRNPQTHDLPQRLSLSPPLSAISLPLVSFSSPSLEWLFLLWPISSKYPPILPTSGWSHITPHRLSRLAEWPPSISSFLYP